MMSPPQMENGILLPTLQSALPFLDLHGTPRLEFHQSVFDELRENLMERVAVIAEGKEADRCVTIASRPFFIIISLFFAAETILLLILASLCSTDIPNWKSCWKRAFLLLKCHRFSRWWCRCWSICPRQVLVRAPSAVENGVEVTVAWRGICNSVALKISGKTDSYCVIRIWGLCYDLYVGLHFYASGYVSISNQRLLGKWQSSLFSFTGLKKLKWCFVMLRSNTDYIPLG